MNLVLLNIYDYIKDDYKTNPFRFVIEITAWVLSIGCAIVMALTVPNPPLIILYPIFIIQCIMYGWAAYTRKSFGMIINYGLLVTIDCIGLVRMLVN
jgi:O-antigen/teichoic acid export membrane protein